MEEIESSDEVCSNCEDYLQLISEKSNCCIKKREKNQTFYSRTEVGLKVMNELIVTEYLATESRNLRVKSGILSD